MAKKTPAAKVEDAYSLVDTIRQMTHMKPEDGGFTNQQLEVLSAKAGIPVSELQASFGYALNKIAQ